MILFIWEFSFYGCDSGKCRNSLLDAQKQIAAANFCRTAWQRMGREENISNQVWDCTELNNTQHIQKYVRLRTNTPNGEDFTSCEVLKGQRRGCYQQNYPLLRSGAIPSHNKGGPQGLQADGLQFHRVKPFAAPGLLRPLICFNEVPYDFIPQVQTLQVYNSNSYIPRIVIRVET